ncbi:MAG: copper chaperone PCu(A)C [Proteobacteria bacterium]|nr:copper chaperone PCu(A)C [Pseudomonadota bacterium]
MTRHPLAAGLMASHPLDRLNTPSPAISGTDVIARVNRRTGLSLLATLITIALPGAANAHDFSIGDIRIGHPWTRATPGGAKVAGGYITIENTGAKPDRLIGGTMEVASRVELHEMSVTDGIMRMRELPAGVSVPAGGRVEMKPGGYHIMFLDLRRPLKQGEKVTGTLVFENAGRVDIEFQVDAMGSPGVPGGHPH